MKALTIPCLLLISMLTSASLTGASPAGKAFVATSKQHYSTATKSVLNLSADDKLTTTTYNSIYIPIKDIFAKQVDSLTWDNTKKLATITNEGKQLLINLSGKSIAASDNQVILPSEWVRIVNGRVSLNAYVLAFIFDRYADRYNDTEQVSAERAQWESKLSFLNIDWTDGLADKEHYIHVNVVFK
ncbi:hypothetical protein G5B47_20030 [Paenibacillus sp. 7124]|uniref:Copper amine oxidase-like N-terminal domain-containing protein n=1 Tax=Paenibacillus apii TaxID=1850370 RepID=A0A6M1PQQ2_9BACL|nr:stalk domain-containing protein [Paenibacillus apii]NGM84694.1 hypothetical protein [Paenibacillus apii]NJJ41311.1 hypothetical protein [Paenibacillus apii]